MDKYLQYNHIELAADSSFIRWVKGLEAEDNLDWDKWQSENPDKESDIQNAKALIIGIKFKQEEVSKTVEDNVWSKINQSIADSSQMSSQAQDQAKTHNINAPKNNIFRLLSYGAVAAVVLVLLLMNIGSDYDTSVQTAYAMMESVTLPDGSTVQMNADTKVEYNIKSWDEDRSVSLEGEAFFSVEKGSKFTVKTNQGQVQVLGTSFNVNTRNDKLAVICKTGRVSVSSGNKETILNPNQAVSIKQDVHDFTEKVASNIDRSKWTKGTYTYNGEILSNVLADLEREYDVKISIDEELAGTKYSGGFAKGDIESSLSEVLWPLDFTFKINGKDVKVNKK